MASQRLIWADALKGWLIILVVLGHAIQYTLGEACEANHLWNIIYSFHMAAFMAVSGYVTFRAEGSYDGRTVLRTVWRRFAQLMIPFAMWTVITQLVVKRVGVENLGEYLLYPDKGLWFLWVLFFINVIFLSGSWLAQKAKCAQEAVIIGICLALVAVMVLLDVRVFGFQFMAYYFLFYSQGYFFRKYEGRAASPNVMLLGFMGVCWAVLAWFWRMHELPAFMQGLPLPATLTQYAYRFVTAAIAIYLLLNLSPSLLDSQKPWNRPFVALGNVSLGIYAVHFLLLEMWMEIFRMTAMNNGGVAACTFVTTLATTWLVVWLLSKWRITATWLLGKV